MQQRKPEDDLAVLRNSRRGAAKRSAELERMKLSHSMLETQCRAFNEGIRAVPGTSNKVLEGGEYSLGALEAANEPEASINKPAPVVRIDAQIQMPNQPQKPNASRKTTSFPTPAPA